MPVGTNLRPVRDVPCDRGGIQVRRRHGVLRKLAARDRSVAQLSSADAARGIAIAAYEVPPSATNNAMYPTALLLMWCSGRSGIGSFRGWLAAFDAGADPAERV